MTAFGGSTTLKELKLSILHAAEGHSRTVKVEGRDVRVRIPPGVTKSDTWVYYGCGGTGMNGGSNGDLHVRITVVDGPRWTLVGKDIHCTESVDLFIALLGGEIVVDTLDGPVNVKIKPETPNGTKMRLRGKGYPATDPLTLIQTLFDGTDFGQRMRECIQDLLYEETEDREKLIFTLFMNLVFLGFSKDKITDRHGFINLVADATHCFYASNCDIFVTEDDKTRKKSAAVFKYLQLSTKILSMVEFAGWVNNVNSPTSAIHP